MTASAPGLRLSLPGSGPVLALDASTLRACAAVVSVDGGLLAHWRQPEGQRGTADLAPAVADLLAQTGCSARDLAGVAVGTGPGSYTGLRAAIAFARALAWAAGRPLAGLPSPASAAALSMADDAGVERVVCLLDARRGQHARTDHSGPLSEFTELSPPQLVPSDEGQAFLAAPPPGVRVLLEPAPDALWLARLCTPRLLAGGDDPALVLPLYLKPSHAELNLDARQHTR